MKMVPKKLTIEIKHHKDCHGRKYVHLEAVDSLGRVHCSSTYGYDHYAGTWYRLENNSRVEVTQNQVFRELLNVCMLMSVEDLITDNLIAMEEDLHGREN